MTEPGQKQKADCTSVWCCIHAGRLPGGGVLGDSEAGRVGGVVSRRRLSWVWKRLAFWSRGPTKPRVKPALVTLF